MLLGLVGVVVLVALVPAAFYGPVSAIVTFMDSGPSFPQALIYLALAAIPVTLLHELGHALAASRLLGTPVSVAVGSIGTIARIELGQISVSLNAIGSPARVAGSATFDASRARVFDILLIALAGPAAFAIGLAFSLALLTASPITGLVHDLLWTMTLGGVFAVVLNLIPFEYQERRDGPAMQTDGRLALDAARTLGALR